MKLQSVPMGTFIKTKMSTRELRFLQEHSRAFSNRHSPRKAFL